MNKNKFIETLCYKKKKCKKPIYQQILITWVKCLVDAMIWLRHDPMVESYSIEHSTTRKENPLVA